MGTPREKLNELLQESWNHVKHGSVKLALFMTTLIGNGGTMTSGANISTDRADAVKETIATPTDKQKAADYASEVERINDLMAEALISQNKNMVGNFDLQDRVFTPEELQMIQHSQQNQELLKTAQRHAQKRRPASGEQTYCLRGVRTILSRNGIGLEADRFAYRAVDGLKKNEHFTEISTEMKDFHSLPDGAVIAWEKGTTKYGHVAMKIGNKEYCDFIYNLRTNNRRGNSGQRYGTPHVFILKDMPLDKELTKKLIAEGRLSEPLRKQAMAKVKIGDMKLALSLKDIAPTNHDLLKIKAPQNMTSTNNKPKMASYFRNYDGSSR